MQPEFALSGAGLPGPCLAGLPELPVHPATRAPPRSNAAAPANARARSVRAARAGQAPAWPGSSRGWAWFRLAPGAAADSAVEWLTPVNPPVAANAYPGPGKSRPPQGVAMGWLLRGA
jgi:hypothetical protein